MDRDFSKFAKIAIVIVTIIICIVIYFVAINVYKNEQIAKKEQETISNEKLYDLDDYPKVDASLATQPLANAYLKNFTALNEIDESKLNYTNTHPRISQIN